MNSEGNFRARLLWIVLTPALVVLVAGGGSIAYILSARLNFRDNRTLIVLGGVLLISIVAIAIAVNLLISTVNAYRERVNALRFSLPRAPEDIQLLVDQWQRGERPISLGALIPGPSGDGLDELASDLDRFRQIATAAVTRIAPMSAGEVGPDQRVGVFVNLARRLQSLVHREINLLDELESQVEDPDLLKGLFAVDHLATRIRRHAENLAVLGGAVSRRQWSRPVNVYAVLRSAVAEVEQYSRVKLTRPIDGNLQGYAVADVVHLVAELVENATRFSPPRTQVLLRVQQVTAGLAIEVEDRGLGLPREDQNRINAMLSEPDQIDIAELLNDGRIGLFVVSTLARRHGIAVQLQSNIYGGTQAVLVLPFGLLGDDTDKTEVHPAVPREIESAPPQPQQPTVLEQRQPAEPPPEPSSPAPQQAMPPTTPSPSPAPVPAHMPTRTPTPATPPPTRAPSPTPMPSRKPLPVAGNGRDTDAATSGLIPQTRSPERRPTEVRRPEEPAPSASEDKAAAPAAAVPNLFWEADIRPQESKVENPAVIHTSAEERPELPRRRRQTHLAPELVAQQPRLPDPVAGHDPDLMAAFRRGFDQASAEKDAESETVGEPSNREN